MARQLACATTAWFIAVGPCTVEAEVLQRRQFRITHGQHFLENRGADDEDDDENMHDADDLDSDDETRLDESSDDVPEDEAEQRHGRVGSFATMGVSVEEGALSNLEDDDVAPGVVHPQDVYAQSHPLIKQTLNSMGDKLKDIKDAQANTMTIREDLQDQQQVAMKNMGRGVAYQRLMASAKADTYVQGKVLQKLHEEEGHLKREHDGVALKLESLMRPRLSAMQDQLDSRSKAVQKTTGQLKKWDGMRKKYHDSALQALVVRKQTAQAVKDVEAEIAELEKREATAKKAYDQARQRVATEIESYKMATTRYEATQAQNVDQREDLQEAEKSMARTKEIFAMERKRIDAALNFSEAKLSKRVKAAQHQQEKARHKFELAKEHLNEWQKKQKDLERKAADMKVQYEGKQRVVDQKRQSVFSAAASKAGDQAVAQSDWNGDTDWAWSGDGEFGGADGMDIEDVSLGNLD